MIYVENELIGRRLKRIRMDRGMDFPDMAEVLEVSTAHYRKIERGVYGLDVRKLLLLYSKLRVDPLYILTGDYGRGVQYVAHEEEDCNSLVCELLDYCKKKLVENTEEDE